MSDFTEWLNQEIYERGWGYNELARRAGVSSGSISHVMTERKNPGFDLCLGIAQALELPPETVLRKAELLPPLPGIDGDVRLGEILDIVRRLSPEEREEMLHYARLRYERDQQKRRRTAGEGAGTSSGQDR